MGVAVRRTSGPTIEKAGDLAGLLTTLERGDVLFIDEIHRLQPAIEEYLYPAMEDFKLDIVIDQGPNARSVRLNLPIYPHRRDDARRHDQRAATLTLWHDCRLDYYTADDLQRSSNAARACSTWKSMSRRARDRQPHEARRGSRIICSAGCATMRRCARAARSPVLPRPGRFHARH